MILPAALSPPQIKGVSAGRASVLFRLCAAVRTTLKTSLRLGTTQCVVSIAGACCICGGERSITIQVITGFFNDSPLLDEVQRVPLGRSVRNRT